MHSKIKIASISNELTIIFHKGVFTLSTSNSSVCLVSLPDLLSSSVAISASSIAQFTFLMTEIELSAEADPEPIRPISGFVTSNSNA